MPNFSKLFHEEVRRLCRKEFKADIDSLKRENIALRRNISELRKKLGQSESRLKKIASNGHAYPLEHHEEAHLGNGNGNGHGTGRERISSKTIFTLRKRLGLTQAEFAKLIGVTGQSVYQWERKDSRLTFRRGAEQRVVALKAIGAREARRRLEELNAQG